MATATQVDFTATTTWQNIIVTIAAASGVETMFQNKGDNPTQIVFGGTIPTSQDAGTILAPLDSMNGTATAVWVKASIGTDLIGVVVV